MKKLSGFVELDVGEIPPEGTPLSIKGASYSSDGFGERADIEYYLVSEGAGAMRRWRSWSKVIIDILRKVPSDGFPVSAVFVKHQSKTGRIYNCLE